MRKKSSKIGEYRYVLLLVSVYDAVCILAWFKGKTRRVAQAS